MTSMLAQTASAMGVVAAETIAGAETMPLNYDMSPRATPDQVPGATAVTVPWTSHVAASVL